MFNRDFHHQMAQLYMYIYFSRYIHRFRHAPPSSRQVRDHNYFDSGKGGEFWWLSPSPPSSSTPKEGTPPDRLLGPSPRPSLSPKLRKSGDRRSVSPGSPVSVSNLCRYRGLHCKNLSYPSSHMC